MIDKTTSDTVDVADTIIRSLSTLSDDGLQIVYVPPTDDYRQRYRVTLYMSDGNKQGEGETLQAAISKALGEA